MNVKRLEHTIKRDYNLFSNVDSDSEYLSDQYIIEGNELTIVSRIKTDKIYRASTTIKLNDEDASKVSKKLNRLGISVLYESEEYDDLAFMESRIVYDKIENDKEVQKVIYNSDKVNDTVDKIMDMVRKKYDEESFDHRHKMFCIRLGRSDKLDGVEVEEEQKVRKKTKKN